MYAKLPSGGSPLAILPGLMCDSRLFDPELVGRADVVIVDDCYGGARSLPAMARHALDRLPARFSLLGHSMGGRIALEVVRLAPERVERLALVSTGVHPVGAGEADKRHALRDLGRAQGMAALVDAWLPQMLAPAHRGDEALVDRLATMCRSAGLVTYEAQIEALLQRPEVASLLPSIACPTLVMTGEHDDWAPPEQHRAIAALIPHAHLRIVSGAGHMLPSECPAAFAAALAAWLALPTPGETDARYA